MVRVLRAVIAGFAVLCATAPQLQGQSETTGAVLPRLNELERAVHSIQEQLAELKTLLGAVKPSGPVEEVESVRLSIADAAARGSKDAKIALIEFSDFQCPYCGRHAQSTYREIQRRYVDTGMVRYVFRNLPIENIHPFALKAAEAAECAGRQGKYWEMHDRLFANQQALGLADLFVHAQALGIEQPEFKSCVTEERTLARIQQDAALARKIRAVVTPTFFIGEIGPEGAVHVTRKISGAQPLTVFQAAFESISTGAK